MRASMRVGLALWVFVLAASSVGIARAQDLRAVRLRFDPALFALDFSTAKLDVEVPPTGPRDPATTTRVETTSATTEVGLFSNEVALGIGGSANDWFNAGLTVLLSYQSINSKTEVGGRRTPDMATSDTTTSRSTVWIVPYMEFVPRQLGPIRPFVGFHAGVGTTSASDDTAKVHTGIAGTVALSGGLHFFVNEYVSIDPYARAGYHGGTAGDVSVTGWTFVGVLGVSAWFGPAQQQQSEVPTPAPEPTAPEAPSEPPPAEIPTEARARLELGTARVELFVTRPQPDTVALTLSRPTTQALHCGRLTLIAGERRTDLATHSYREVEGEGRAQVTTDVPIGALRSLIDEGQVLTAIDACNQRHYITLPQRNGLRAFIEQRDAMIPPPTQPPPTAPTEAPVPETVEPAPITPEALPEPAPRAP